MAKKIKSKKGFNKKLLLIPLIVFMLAAAWFTVNDKFRPNPNNQSLIPSPTEQTRKTYPTVKANMGGPRDVEVISGNDRFFYGRFFTCGTQICNEQTKIYGHDIFKKVNGEWVPVANFVQQTAPCTDFEALGMTEQDFNDLKVLRKDGGCFLTEDWKETLRDGFGWKLE